MSQTIYIELVAQTCWSCGVIFGLHDEMRKDLIARGRSFSCPRGCSLRFGESEADKLRKQLVGEQAAHERTRADRDAKERTAIALRGQVTKIKNRVANGVCPCCHRTFQNILRHMQTKHPTFKDDSQ